ncbi:MAG: hypothetical protein U0625_05680 [Phycisphaerales bacterium]
MQTRARRRLRSAAAVAIAGLACVRTLAMHAPLAWFDMDPLLATTAFPGITPAVSLAMDAAMLLCSALVLSTLLGAPLRRWALAAVVLAVLPAGAVLLHGAADADDLWRGTQWLATVVGAVALAAACACDTRSRTLRAALLGILLGALAPMLVRAGVQLGVEHPATVAHYHAERAQFLAARGWAPDSPQALLYERRLEQREASAWFGLANLLSSCCAAGAIALAALAIGARRRIESGTLLVLWIAAAGCAAVVAINGSKGATAALVLGAAVAALAARRTLGARGLARLAVALVLLAALAVVARGMVGEASGERSLLFRWHYLQGAMRALAQSPLAGVGPDSFSEAYLRLRPGRAPEEIQSAHSAWADWLAALGAAAAAWIALLLAAAWGAGRAAGAACARAAAPLDPGDADDPAGVRAAWIAAGVVLLAALAGIAVEHESLDAVGLATRLGGAALGAMLALAATTALLAAPGAAAAGLLGAVVALLSQAQIEMTLWQPGSAGWIAALVAVAAAPAGAWVRARVGADTADDAAPADGPSRGARALLGLGAGFVAALAGVTLVRGALPARAAEAAIADAAAPLAHAGQLDPVARGPVDAARADAANALLAGLDARTPADDRWSRRTEVLGVGLDQLADAIAQQPRSVAPADRALRRAQALALASLAVDLEPSHRVLGAAAFVAESVLAQPDAEAAQRAAALALLERAAQGTVERNPRSVRGWSRIAEAARLRGDADAARAAARRALEADASYELDPLRRLPAGERATLESLAK